jgi:hypothetical protein
MFDFEGSWLQMKIKYSTLALSISTFLLFSQCTTRTLILTAPSISATHLPTGQEANLKPGSGEASGTFCLGDKPTLSKDSRIGLIDEAVFLAQKKAKAKFLQNASVYLEEKAFSSPCVVVSGTPLK